MVKWFRKSVRYVHPEILDDIHRTTTWTCNAISIRMFSTETTGPIFTKILHDVGALVASSSKTKPSYHLANVQRMHVVSVCLHFDNIIWLPWQRPLTNWKIKYRSIMARKALSYGEKIAKFGPVRPEMFDEIRRTMTWKQRKNLLRPNYWTDLRKNFTWLSGPSWSVRDQQDSERAA